MKDLEQFERVQEEEAAALNLNSDPSGDRKNDYLCEAIKKFVLVLAFAIGLYILIQAAINFNGMSQTRFNEQITLLLGNQTSVNTSTEANIQQLSKKQSSSQIYTLEQMKKAYPNMVVRENHVENKGKELGELFTVKVKDMEEGEEYGIGHRIQVASQLDYISMMDKVDFTRLEKQMGDAIAHQLITFDYKAGENEPSLGKVDDGMDEEDINEVNQLAKSMGKDNEMDFGIWLTKNIDNKKLRLLEYLYYSKKHKIDKFPSQTPICIYSASYNIHSKNRYKLFFQSLNRQNYSNYHILYIDDNSPDQSAYKIFAYLNSSTASARVRARLTIVHNLQRMGALANMFFWIKRYCAEGSIVVTIDGDDSLMGAQVFRLLNAVYQDEELWYLYSKYLNYYTATGGFEHGYLSQPLEVSTSKYRLSEDYWVTSHLRTFRQKLMRAVPIYHFIEYHYDNVTRTAMPRFYGSAADRYQVYSQLELAGTDRVRHISDPLYLYDPTVGNIERKCYREHEFHQEYKSRIKTPLKRLESWQESAILVQDYKIPSQILANLTKSFQARQQCNQRASKST